MSRPLSEVLVAFNQAFNRNDLDAVMTYFTDDAEYLPGDGQRHRGRAAIRAAFAPQFAGAFGTMRFDVEDEFIDERARKATSRWTCHHDLTGAARMNPLLRLAIRARFGRHVAWHGVDVFHFDAAGQITGKYTYANYQRPRLFAVR